MSDPFALGSFLARWGHAAHNLAASEAATLSLADLLALAEPDDQRRWQALSLGYAAPRGADWLRDAIARRYTGAGADDVLCCAGAQEALASLVPALLGSDDHAIIVVPLYQPSERTVTSLCAATGVALAERDGRWVLDVERIAAAIRPRTKLVLMNFPNSPTGAALDRATLDALVALCRRHGLWLVNDEVYRGMAADTAGPPPVADLYERGISIDALSKSFGLPGLRAGWLVCRDRALLGRALLVKSGLSSCVGSANEVLAHIALRAAAAIVGANRAIGRRHRQGLAAVLGRHPDLFAPDATGNLGFAAPRYLGGRDATGFATSLARDAGILLLPSGLWRTPLADVATDRLRIGLGAAGVAAALAALDAHLARRHAEAAVA